MKNPDWIHRVWEGLVREALGLHTEPRADLQRPALMRSGVTTPELLRHFARFNKGKPYAAQIKPFNFLLSVHVARLDWPIESDPAGFHLITSFTRDPGEWLKLEWIDLYSGASFRIHVGRRTTRANVRARTYADVLDRYRVHPEPKSVAPDGSPSDEQTVGLLGRGDDHVVTVRLIGKEANLIEQQEEGGLLGDPQAVYDDPKNPGGWEVVRRRLGPIPATHLAALTGLSPRFIRDVKHGEKQPSAATREKLTEAVIRCLNHPPDPNTLEALESAQERKRGQPRTPRTTPRRRWKLRNGRNGMP